MIHVWKGDEVVLLGHHLTPRGIALLALDVGLVTFLVARLVRLIRGTRAVPVLVGLSLVGLAYVGARASGLELLELLLGHFLRYSFLLWVVLFQSDIRRALAELGKSSSWLRLLGRDPRAARRGAVDAVVRGVLELSRRRIGALVVLERSADLSEVIESGLRVDGAVTPELLQSIFLPGGPLHDGAVVIQGARLAAAGCLLPLSGSAQPHELGTRHRAALGLAEEVDAVVVVVSEERGEISVAVDGALQRRLDEPGLRVLLHTALGTGRPGASPGSGSGAGPFRDTPSPRSGEAPAGPAMSGALAAPAASAGGGPLNTTTPTHRFDR